MNEIKLKPYKLSEQIIKIPSKVTLNIDNGKNVTIPFNEFWSVKEITEYVNLVQSLKIMNLDESIIS
jgi:hypothetical protein